MVHSRTRKQLFNTNFLTRLQ